MTKIKKDQPRNKEGRWVIRMKRPLIKSLIVIALVILGLNIATATNKISVENPPMTNEPPKIGTIEDVTKAKLENVEKLVNNQIEQLEDLIDATETLLHAQELRDDVAAQYDASLGAIEVYGVSAESIYYDVASQSGLIDKLNGLITQLNGTTTHE